MITFSKFGNHGNLGNQLHQYASLIGFAEKYSCELVLPEWNYAQYFRYPPRQAVIKPDISIEEQYYHYTPEFWDLYAQQFRTKRIDILGWLQTEKYWEHCKEKVHHALQFEETFQNNVKAKFRKALEKETIAISIRRGDFITNPNFYFLSIEYYLGALQLYFPECRKCNVIFFSDDLDYCLAYIKHYPNFHFAKGLNGIEQLCLMSHCTHFIISNSTFSWWGAMLGETVGSKIIRPAYVFEEELKAKFNIKDCFPERWQKYDHLLQSVDTTCFQMPFLNQRIISCKLRLVKKYSKKKKFLLKRLQHIFNSETNDFGS